MKSNRVYRSINDSCAYIAHVRWITRVQKYYLANSKESHHEKKDVTTPRVSRCGSSLECQWYEAPCINIPLQEDLQDDGVIIKYLTSCNLHSQRQERLENIAKWHRTSLEQQKNIAHKPDLSKDTEISACDWPSDKITLPGIQGEIICFGRPMMTKFSNGFSDIFQCFNMQNILNPVFCEEQHVRSISTQTKLAQQKKVKKEKHYAPPSYQQKQNCPSQSVSPSNSTGQLTRRQKLQKAVKEYGSTVMVFHVTISLISLGTFYLAVSSGIDMENIMSYFDVGDKIPQSQLIAGTSTFVIAYAIHKVFAPVRIGITLSATPFIVRYLRLKGILKP